MLIEEKQKRGAFVVKSNMFNRFAKESIDKKDIDRIYSIAYRFEKNIEVRNNK